MLNYYAGKKSNTICIKGYSDMSPVNVSHFHNLKIKKRKKGYMLNNENYHNWLIYVTTLERENPIGDSYYGLIG